jgi:hypothetical protein
VESENCSIRAASLKHHQLIRIAQMPSGDRVEMATPASNASAMLRTERRWADNCDLAELDSVVVKRTAAEVRSAPAKLVRSTWSADRN